MLEVTNINDMLKKNSQDLKNKNSNRNKTFKAKQKQKQHWRLE